MPPQHNENLALQDIVGELQQLNRLLKELIALIDAATGRLINVIAAGSADG